MLAEVVPRVRIDRQRAERLAHEGVRGHRGHQRVGQADVGRVRQQQPLPRLLVERKGGNAAVLLGPQKFSMEQCLDAVELRSGFLIRYLLIIE